MSERHEERRYTFEEEVFTRVVIIVGLHRLLEGPGDVDDFVANALQEELVLLEAGLWSVKEKVLMILEVAEHGG